MLSPLQIAPLIESNLSPGYRCYSSAAGYPYQQVPHAELLSPTSAEQRSRCRLGWAGTQWRIVLDRDAMKTAAECDGAAADSESRSAHLLEGADRCVERLAERLDARIDHRLDGNLPVASELERLLQVVYLLGPILFEVPRAADNQQTNHRCLLTSTPQWNRSITASTHTSVHS